MTAFVMFMKEMRGAYRNPVGFAPPSCPLFSSPSSVAFEPLYEGRQTFDVPPSTSTDTRVAGLIAELDALTE
jgi:hypothetical protein